MHNRLYEPPFKPCTAGIQLFCLLLLIHNNMEMIFADGQVRRANFDIESSSAAVKALKSLEGKANESNSPGAFLDFEPVTGSLQWSTTQRSA